MLPIIGSGPNGLAAAFYLARAGHTPVVFERGDDVGGGAITGEVHPGFRLPTLSHEMLLHETIVRDMDLRRHGLQLIESDVEVCAPSPGGVPLVIHADAARTADGLRHLDAEDAGRWPAYRQSVTRAAQALGPLLTTAPPHIDAPSARDVWDILRTGRRVRGLGPRGTYDLLRWLPMPVFDFAHEWFGSERLRAVVAASGLSGTMLGPRSAGSTLVGLLREAHRQLAGGRALQARGGPGACTAAMAAAARAAGAEIRTGTPVERVVIRDGRVTGIVAAGAEIAATHVISAIDPKSTFLRLIDAPDLTPDLLQKMRNYRSSGTVAKLNLALSALPEFAGVTDNRVLSGRIHLGERLDDLERAFDGIKYGEMSADPWLDLTIPSIADPTLAPSDAHVASVYVHNAPYRLRQGPWTTDARDELRRRALAVLERYAPGISALVIEAQLLTPEDLERVHGAWGGHIFHGELAPDQLFAMRPFIGMGRYRTPIDGLFLCGAGTHPGGFMTGASGRLGALEVLQKKSLRQ